ncbi:MAG: AgmX/PglI C-terminal domain-containing protein [Myxococcota bacterium]
MPCFPPGAMPPLRSLLGTLPLLVPLLAAGIASPAVANGPAMEVGGITGSISEVDATRALQPRMPQFAQCFVRHADELPSGRGDVRLHIRVGTTGQVLSAYPEMSTVGHRGVERCLGEVAMRTRFPRPRGGEATVTWPISLDLGDEAPEPAVLSATQVRRVVEDRGAEAMTMCGVSSTTRVTAYVQGGRVLTLGAAVFTEVESSAIDCLVEQVRQWPIRSGRRIMMVTFDLTPESAGDA